MSKDAAVSITIPENAVRVNTASLPLYWDGVRWSTIHPDTKITVLDSSPTRKEEL